MQFATATWYREGVTLVHLRLENDGRTPRRVRVANRLDGPVWFPRRGGHPAPGWDEGGYEGVLAVGERRALGYACPADPTDPPAEVAWTERAADPQEAGFGRPRDHGSGQPREARRGHPPASGADPAHVTAWALADPRPPREAVPVAPVGPAIAPEAARTAPRAGGATTAGPDSDPGHDSESDSRANPAPGGSDRGSSRHDSRRRRAAAAIAAATDLLAPLRDRLGGIYPRRR